MDAHLDARIFTLVWTELVLVLLRCPPCEERAPFAKVIQDDELDDVSEQCHSRGVPARPIQAAKLCQVASEGIIDPKLDSVAPRASRDVQLVGEGIAQQLSRAFEVQGNL